MDRSAFVDFYDLRQEEERGCGKDRRKRTKCVEGLVNPQIQRKRLAGSEDN